jgi:hypothetical protein
MRLLRSHVRKKQGGRGTGGGPGRAGFAVFGNTAPTGAQRRLDEVLCQGPRLQQLPSRLDIELRALTACNLEAEDALPRQSDVAGPDRRGQSEASAARRRQRPIVCFNASGPRWALPSAPRSL